MKLFDYNYSYLNKIKFLKSIEVALILKASGSAMTADLLKSC